jgi:hypothetical protein
MTTVMRFFAICLGCMALLTVMAYVGVHYPTLKRWTVIGLSTCPLLLVVGFAWASQSLFAGVESNARRYVARTAVVVLSTGVAVAVGFLFDMAMWFAFGGGE